MDLDGYLAERRVLVDRALDEALPGPGAAPERLQRAMRHLLFPGGKRLRPAFAFAAAEAVGAPPAVALPMAAAVELVHTYSLVHDDLPCMDDDVERRGRATVHVEFDEATALLAGDALLAAAFEVLSKHADTGATLRLASLQELAHAAGAGGLVGGQLDDLASPRAPSPNREDVDRVESIHRRKSAALFVAAVVGGAHLGAAGSEALARLRRFGEHVGLGFQIADDLLDEGDDDGCSLVRLLGRDAAGQRALQHLEEALANVDDLGERAEPLRELARFAIRRDR